MKRTPDPLLEAVLGRPGPAVAGPPPPLLAAARRRRRTRAARRMAATALLPALLAGVVWLMLRPAAEVPPSVPRPYTLVRSAPSPAGVVVVSAAGAAHEIRTRSDGVRWVSTADAPAPHDLATDDGALLALLPGGAGLVGEPGQRMLFWTGLAPE